MNGDVLLPWDLLPLAMVALPLVAGPLVLILLPRWRSLGQALVLGSVTLTLLGAGSLALQVSGGNRIGIRFPALLGQLELAADPFSTLFALFAALVWFAVTLYALAYLKDDPGENRFHGASLALQGAALGIFLAGDLITLFVFFELLGLVAFLLVIHAGTEDARHAGATYLWMMLGAGLLVLAGILLTYGLGGDGSLAPLPDAWARPGLRWAAAGLLILGFGVKAGMLPVHIWLPHAHSVAPTPASALLSGVVIKAGAYGIFRTLSQLFSTESGLPPAGALQTLTVDPGLVVLWLGVATMLVGVVLALAQDNAKRLLAYSSVSQMGFILTGFGAAFVLSQDGSMGMGGGLLHATNHALFKSCLFLGVGAVALRTGTLELGARAGVWRQMPLTFGFMLVASAGIAGVPLFNGFVSKGMIHHALEGEVLEVGALGAGALSAGAGSLALAELIFTLTSVGTVAVLLKLMVGLFHGGDGAALPNPRGPEEPAGTPTPHGLTDAHPAQALKEAPPAMLAAMGLLALAILALGLRPHLLLDKLVAPGLQELGVSAHGIQLYLEEYFLRGPDLLSALLVLALGTLLFLAGRRWNLFQLRGPAWLGVEHWYRKGARGGVVAVQWISTTYEQLRQRPSRWVELRQKGGAPPGWIGSLSPLEGLWSGLPTDLSGALARGRRGVRRYSGALSLSLALIFVLLLLLLATVRVGGGL